MTGTPEGSPRRHDTAAATPGAGRKTRRRTMDELHGSLEAAWEAVNEVARLVEELHRTRGHGRLR